ncbi:hypothetical protein GMRT_13554 [Giardia muris]|uniref:Coiled-coil domain-containing protein 86 n=1 Tax=Giardia muris TaxID=5742 RepID=A0A4Z1SW24_GIAMU|nr:hypothetical protein GMRT_13554 [Giardia muris]|eukprot:TNJ29974.1 hypothetical protein GMRT_13554 [Giardia muris]
MAGHVTGSALSKSWKSTTKVLSRKTKKPTHERIAADRAAHEARMLEKELQSQNNARIKAAAAKRKERRVRREEALMKGTQMISSKKAQKMTPKQRRAMNIIKVD